MWSSKTRRKTSSVASAVARITLLLKPNVPIILLFNFCEHSWTWSTLTVTAFSCSFSKKNNPIMPLEQNPHHTVTRFGCVGFSMYACGFSVPQFCATILLVYIPAKIKMSFIWKDDFFFAKIGIFCRSQAHLAKRINNHIYSAEG